MNSQNSIIDYLKSNAIIEISRDTKSIVMTDHRTNGLGRKVFYSKAYGEEHGADNRSLMTLLKIEVIDGPFSDWLSKACSSASTQLLEFVKNSEVYKDDIGLIKQRQTYLDERTGIEIGDFVLEEGELKRVAAVLSDKVIQTGGGGVYVGSSYTEYSGSLDLPIEIKEFTYVRKKSAQAWFFARGWITGGSATYADFEFKVFAIDA